MLASNGHGAFRIAVFSLGVSILSAAFTFWNAKTNRDALTTVQRAFVFPKHFDTSVTLEGSSPLRGHNIPVWENSGNTPTKKLLLKQPRGKPGPLTRARDAACLVGCSPPHTRAWQASQ